MIYLYSVKKSVYALILSVFALVAVGSASADTIVASNITSGASNAGSGLYLGTSFFTTSGSAFSNLIFNLYSDSSSTTSYAVGTGFLLNQAYVGSPGSLNSGAPGYIASAVASGNVYTFNVSVSLQGNTEYWFYENAPTTNSYYTNPVPSNLAVYSSSGAEANFNGVPTVQLTFKLVASSPLPPSWNVPSGDWTVGSNWTGGTPPDAFTGGMIDNSGTATLSGTTGNAAPLNVGLNNSNNGLIITNSGSLGTVSSIIGSGSSSSYNSALVTGTGSIWNNTGLLFIGGDGSNNSLTINNGGALTDGGAIIGNGTNSAYNTVLLTGVGSSWTTTNLLYVGGSGSNNSLTLSGGATMSTGGFELGDQAGSVNNTATITGTGTTWTYNGGGYVGLGGSGNSLTISQGGVVNAQSTNGFSMGFNAGSNNNSVVVTGSGSLLENVSVLTVGQSGTGNTLSITSGGSVTDARAIIGGTTGGIGNSVLVNGAGSTWNNSALLIVGQGDSRNSVTISNGATVTTGTVGPDSSFIGYNTTANNNTVTVDGGTFTNVGQLTIGNYGNSNSLVITNGGVVSNSNGLIAFRPGSTDNSVTVDGTGSQWNNSGFLYVGRQGDNSSLTISNSAVVTVSGTDPTGFSSFIGYKGPASNNSVLVTTGGAWNNSQGLVVGGIGTGTNNSMTVSVGGQVTNTVGSIGDVSTSTGNSVLVTGTGSKWTNNGNLYVGYAGGGALTVADGGNVSASAITLALMESSTGTLNIGSGGAAGTITSPTITGGDGTAVVNFNHSDSLTFTSLITGNLSVNKFGAGTTILTASNSYSGGTTVKAGTLSLGEGGAINHSAANLVVGDTVGDFGTLDLNGGLISASNGIIGNAVGSSGAATVSSGTWTNTGDLTIGLSGTGTLNVSGGSVSSNILYVGNNGGSSGVVTLTGGSIQANFVAIGEVGGTGALFISGGVLTNPDAYISDYTGGGSATVSSGTWNNTGNLYIGGGGLGTLDITGGLVTTGVSARLGLGSNTEGRVTVSGGTFQNAGDLIVGDAGTGTLNLTGSGVVTIASGTGTLTIAAQAGSNGTLNLGTGGVAGTLLAATVIGGSGTATVNFNHTGSYTFAPQLTGNLSVNQVSGTTNLTGSNTYTGLTTVQNGALIINGSVAGDVTILGGLLGGSGVIGGNVINRALVSPGNSPGTLTIGGNYTQTATGTLFVQIASSTVYDRLVIGGTATLGGTLQVSFLNGYTPTKGETFKYITAGFVTGAFTNIETDSIIKLQASYFSSEGTLELVELTAVQGLFAEVKGLTPNEHAVAKGLDKVVNDPRVSKLVNYLDGFALAKIPQKLEKIVPTDLIPMFDASINSANVQADNLERRMEEIRSGATGFSASGLNLSDSHGTRSFNGNADAKQAISKDGKELTPAPISDRWGFFINGSGEFVDEESTAIARGTDFTTGGITAGADYRLGDHAAVGLTTGYANTSSNGRGDGPVKIDSGKLGLYGTVFDRGFFLNGAVGGGLNSFDTQRNTLGGLARGDANGTDFNALLGTGYTYRKGGLSAGPIASMRYSWAGIDSFTERGSLAPLKISSQSEASLKSTVGLQTSYAFQLGKTTTLTPQIRAQWQHENLDTARGIGASFLPGGAFTVYGPAIGRDSLLLDVGASLQLTQTVGVFTFYTGNLGGNNYTSHAINGGVQVSF